MRVYCLLSIVLCLIFSTQTFASFNLYYPGFRNYTVASNIDVVGPVLGRESDEKYVSEIFSHIISAADDLVRDDYYVDGKHDNYTYYAFLVGALTVPHHESMLGHFRYRYGDTCSDEINQVKHKNASSRLQKIINEEYRNDYGERGVVFPNCNYLDSQSKYVQALGSTDFSDFGIMQLNYRSHRHTLYPEYFLNLYNSVDYGVRYFFSAKTPSWGGAGGFKQLRSIISKKGNLTGCNVKSAPYKNGRTTFYYNLIRASWDLYNQGTALKFACRFEKKPKSGHVSGFKRSLDSIVLNNNSLYHKYLKEGSLERKAFDEIIHNFKAIYIKSNEKNENIRKLMARHRSELRGEVNYGDNGKYNPTHTTAESDTRIFSVDEPFQENVCGVVEAGSSLEVILNNRPVRVQLGDDDTNELYIKVKIPEYATFVKTKFEKAVIKLKNTRNFVNVRKSKFVPEVHNDEDILFEWKDTNVDAEVLVQDDDGWAFLNFSDGKSGWVYINSGFLKKTMEYRNRPEQCNTNHNTYYMNINDLRSIKEYGPYTKGHIGYASIKASSLKVRGIGSPRGEDLKKRVFKGELVEIIDINVAEDGSEWYQINHLGPERFQGWISADSNYSKLDFMVKR